MPPGSVLKRDEEAMPDKADEILTTMFDVYQAALQDLRGRCEASLQQARDLILSASGNIIILRYGKIRSSRA